MPAEILILSVSFLVVALLFLSLLTRKRPRHSPRLVRASLESPLSITPPEVRPLPKPPATQLRRSQPEPQPSVTPELPLDIEATMPLGYTAAKAMRSETQSAPLFVTAPAGKKVRAVITKLDAKKTNSGDQKAVVADLEATTVVNTVKAPSPPVVVEEPVSDSAPGLDASVLEDDEKSLADTVEQIEKVVLAPPYAPDDSPLAETEASTEIDGVSETEAATEAEATSETEAAPELEATSEIEAAPELEANSEIEAAPETEATSEIEAAPETEASSETEAAPETEATSEIEAAPEHEYSSEIEDAPKI